MDRIIAFSALVAACVACAPKLEEKADMLEVVDTAVNTKPMGGAVFETTVAAISDTEWIHFSFETGQEPYVATSTQSRDWDLRFLRFNIRVNGGMSGPGIVKIAVLEDLGFDQITQAPASPYFTDERDADDNGLDELAFRKDNSKSENGWFQYEGRFHTVTPSPVTYVVAAMNGVYYKVEYTGYYDENGEGGYPQFRWAGIVGPTP